MYINGAESPGSLTAQDGTANTVMFNHLRVGPVASDMRGVAGLRVCPVRAHGLTTPSATATPPNDTGRRWTTCQHLE